VTPDTLLGDTHHAAPVATGECLRGAVGGTVWRELVDQMLLLGCQHLVSMLTGYADRTASTARITPWGRRHRSGAANRLSFYRAEEVALREIGSVG